MSLQYPPIVITQIRVIIPATSIFYLTRKPHRNWWTMATQLLTFLLLVIWFNNWCANRFYGAAVLEVGVVVVAIILILQAIAYISVDARWYQETHHLMNYETLTPRDQCCNTHNWVVRQLLGATRIIYPLLLLLYWEEEHHHYQHWPAVIVSAASLDQKPTPIQRTRLSPITSLSAAIFRIIFSRQQWIGGSVKKKVNTIHNDVVTTQVN